MNTPTQDIEQQLRIHYQQEIGEPASFSTFWQTLADRLPPQEQPIAWWQRWLQAASMPGGLRSSAPLPSRSSSRQSAQLRPLRHLVASGLAALVLLILVATLFVQGHFTYPFPRTGLPAFTDANALQLGSPLYSFQSNPSPWTSQSQLPAEQPQFVHWSTDGRFFSSLQVNIPGNHLQVRVLDTASGQVTIYPVLDASWVPVGNPGDVSSFSPFSFFLVGNDLVAFRPQGTKNATMVIWDITGQRQLAQQTLSNVHAFIVPAQNEQKFALLVSGNPPEIWDTASGQRLVICQGPLPTANIPGKTQWYNHDQDLLSFNVKGHLRAWSAATGNILFDRSDPAKTYYQVAISPDNASLALAIGPQNAFAQSAPPQVESVEILDALSGVVRSIDPQNATFGSYSFDWLPDNQHLRAMYGTANGSKELMRVWDAFNNQDSLHLMVPAHSAFFSRDSRYLILENADYTSLKILQPSNGRVIATLAMPYYSPIETHSILLVTAKYVILVQDHTIYAWSALTGQLLYKYHGSLPYPSTRDRGAVIFSSPDSRYLVIVGYSDAQSTIATTDIWQLS